MKATFKVLSDDEHARVHEESLNLLGKTGVCMIFRQNAIDGPTLI